MTLRLLSLLFMGLSCVSCTDPQHSEQRVSPFGQLVDDDAGAQVVSNSPVILPDDHASHPAFDLEWWYLTATLTDASDTPYGFQFTLFRIRQQQSRKSEWSNEQRWLAHVSLHSPDIHYFEEKIARGGVGNAGVDASPFRAFIDHWQWQARDPAPAGYMFPSTLYASVGDNVSVRLSLEALGTPVLHGKKGVSVKSAEGDFRSYYYSQPFISINGTLSQENSTVEVTGSGWFDHEWTSQLASDKALGWDWLSLSLDNGHKLMAFTMYVEDSPPYTTGTLISPDGTTRTLNADAITLSPTGYEEYEGKHLPVNWAVTVPSAGIDLDVTPFKRGQWNPGVVAYYEGRVQAKGSHTATGFLELTGY